MPIDNAARKREARRLAKERGINYTAALRVVTRTAESQQAEPDPPSTAAADSPGRNVFTDFIGGIPALLDAAVSADPQRLMLVCPAATASGMARALEEMGAPRPVVTLDRYTLSSALPNKGTVILPESRMSMAIPKKQAVLAGWSPQVLALPYAQDLLSQSKRSTLARRLSRSSGLVLAAVPNFDTLGPTHLRSLLVLTKHAQTTFGRSFTEDYLRRVPAPFRTKGTPATVLDWYPERRDALKKMLVEHVLVDSPSGWPMDTRDSGDF